MIFYADILGVFVSALSGALLAARKEMDIYGFFVLGLVAGIGGGTLRDVILELPVFWVIDQRYLITALVAGVIAILFARQAMNGWRRRGILWLDALAMSFFAATGATKALDYDAAPLVVILMGFLTAVAGGLLRDMIAQETPYIFRGEIYATAAIFGASLIVIANAIGIAQIWLIPIGMIGAFTLRALAIIYNWQLSVHKRVE